MLVISTSTFLGPNFQIQNVYLSLFSVGYDLYGNANVNGQVETFIYAKLPFGQIICHLNSIVNCSYPELQSPNE